jgi:hypothetical protein
MSDYLDGNTQTMPSDADVWQSAWIIAEQYGAEGVDFAAQMAQSFEIGGKLDEQKVWLSIMQKVETLTSEGARPH